MRFDFTATFFQDLDQLKRENARLGFKIWQLIESIQETPFEGLGNQSR